MAQSRSIVFPLSILFCMTGINLFGSSIRRSIRYTINIIWSLQLFELLSTNAMTFYQTIQPSAIKYDNYHRVNLFMLSFFIKSVLTTISFVTFSSKLSTIKQFISEVELKLQNQKKKRIIMVNFILCLTWLIILLINMLFLK